MVPSISLKVESSNSTASCKTSQQRFKRGETRVLVTCPSTLESGAQTITQHVRGGRNGEGPDYTLVCYIA